MNALQFSIWHALPHLSVYLANLTGMDISEKCADGRKYIDIALTSPKKVEMVSVVLSIGFDLNAHLWDFCRCIEAWEQIPGLLGRHVPVSKSISKVECLQMISSVSTRRIHKGPKHLQYKVVSCLMTALSQLVTDSTLIELGEVDAHLQCLLGKTLSIDQGNVHIVPLLIGHYGVKVDHNIVTDVLRGITTKRFQQKRHQVLKEHPRFLQSIDFLLAYCYSPKHSSDAAALRFLRQVPTEVVETIQSLNNRWGFQPASRIPGGPTVEHTDPEANQLIEVIEDFDLYSTLQPGTITYEEGERKSTIDLCLVTFGLVDRLIRSEVDREIDHGSDHLPIVTELDVSITQMKKEIGRNWKALDEKVFDDILRLELPPLLRPRTKAALDRYVREIVTAIQKAAEEATSIRRPSVKSRAGWNEEFSKAVAEAKRLKPRNKKGRVIKKALRKGHQEKVEKASESPESLWKLAKWARNREALALTTTPAIKDPSTGHEVTEPSAKAMLFRVVSFPIPPEADLSDIEHAAYGDRINTPPITEQEVEEAIRETAPFKAPGPDGIINKVLKVAAPRIRTHLTRIFNQRIRLGYCPQHFRESTTVVLRKPGKDNYTIPKAYRPIALLNTTGKIMDSIIAKRLNFLAEAFKLLPEAHMGGRKLRSTEHAMHHILDKIYEAWNIGRGKVASLLLLDVSEAFDNVSHKRLLHNLRKRRVDEKIVRWIASSLRERYTTIVVDGYKSEPYRLTTGMPQGSTYSPILYLFYNADLIDSCNDVEDTTTTCFIDDVAILATGDTTEDTCSKLGKALGKAMKWSTKHASIFAPEKFQLTHFTRTRKRFNTHQALCTPSANVQAKPTCKYLGFTMDTGLRWKQHIDEIQRKATKTISALSSLGSSTWGLKFKDLRKTYRSVVIPQIMYACSAWSNTNWGTRGAPYTKHTLATLESLQARAARMISGAFRATSSPALDVETHLLPMEHQIWKHNLEALIRLGPAKSEPMKARQKISPRDAIQRVLDGRQGPSLKEQESIPPYITPPWWRGPKTYIEETADRAVARHHEEKNALTLTLYMGDESVSTVYAAELQGIILALQIALDATAEQQGRNKVCIYTDNQAAIRSVAKPKGKSGAYLLHKIARQIDDLHRQHVRVEIRWIPSHQGIQGNEAADKAAKEATGWRDDNQAGPRAETSSEIYPLTTTMRAWISRTAFQNWQEGWERETRGRTTFRHTQKPTRKVLQLHAQLSRRQSSLLTQLRTEKIGLKEFLFNRHAPGITDPKCNCGERWQTVMHVLLQCQKYQRLRRQLLGPFPGSLRRIVNERKSAVKAIKFMEQTQILGQFRIET
uniref:Reverse transcriptase domain-containing protein n=1 Tax=Bionectria ochroleuca TaxID=29856 RepID=A0A8H7K1V6_BIOOC